MPDESPFQPIDTTLEEILPPNEKYTFLVGAGISKEVPSMLGSALDLVEALIKKCAPPEEVEKILQLPNLRYELVVELIQKYFDPNLKIMEYFEFFTSPNIFHYFLANSINSKHNVMTTNFDYLIEYAMIHIIGDKSKIVPIITKQDFLNFPDPEVILKQGKFPLYKLHGSSKNIIDLKDTKETLITTISSLGKEREKGETFAIEPFKKLAVNNLMKDSTLIIMGYSGSDDFDIGPTLKELQGIKKILWINYTSSKNLEIKTITEPASIQDSNLTNEEKLLNEIAYNAKQLGKSLKIYKIDINTSYFIKEYLRKIFFPNISILELNEGVKPPVFSEWIEPILETDDLGERYILAWDIFYKLAYLEDALRCCEKALELAEIQNKSTRKAKVLFDIGIIYRNQGKIREALEKYQQALEINRKNNNLEGIAVGYTNIGLLYKETGKFTEALEHYSQALKLYDDLNDEEGKAIIYANMGAIYDIQDKHDMALEYLELALEIDSKIGNLDGKAADLNNIAIIYAHRQFHTEALERYEEALKIDEQLGDLLGKALRLNNIGEIYRVQGKYQEALEIYEKALEIDMSLGNLKGQSTELNNLGIIYHRRGDLETALEYYQKSIKLNQILDDLEGKYLTSSNIGFLYEDMGDLTHALEWLEGALQITINLGIDNTQNARALKDAIEGVKSLIDMRDNPQNFPIG